MKVVIRADASNLNGGGHVARSLKLAEELEKQGARVIWACSAETLEMRPDLEKYSPVIVAETDSDKDKNFLSAEEQIKQASLIQDAVENADLLIVDQYFLDSSFEDRAREFVSKIAVIDEKLNRPHTADMIFDFMPHTTQDWTALGLIDTGQTQLHSGPDAMMLAPLFSELAAQKAKPLAVNSRKKESDNAKPQNVVITSGAYDGVNLIGRVLDAFDKELKMKKRVKIDIPILSKAPHIDELRSKVKSMQNKGFDITLHEDCTSVPQLISKADIHIGSAATSTYEAGAAGGVAGLYYDCGHMQTQVGRLAQKSGASLFMGHHEDFSAGQLLKRVNELLDNPNLRDHRARNSAKFCDGKGLGKVVDKLNSL
jgi:spore coat polysaccharide biosynthesis predicted glycosyltransferase SpsG